MKDLKKKLTAAAAMLVVSAVMLSGVSYAWYTLSTNPEVKGITATAVANQNLEIALKYATDQQASDVDNRSKTGTGAQGSGITGNNYTWGNLVTISDELTNTAKALRPATYVEKDAQISGVAGETYKATDSNLYYPEYGADGRISGFKALTTADAFTNTATDKGGVREVYAGTTDKTNYAFCVDYWVRTNIGGNITLSTKTNRDTTNTNSNEGSGSYIKTAQYGAAQDKYTKEAVKVVFKVTDANGNVKWVEADNGDIQTDTTALTGTIIPNANPNEVYQVSMYVYLNGNVVTNAMAKEAVSNIEVNVQFDNSGITDKNPGAMQK